MSDISNKLQLIDRMQRYANKATELDDAFKDMLGIISSRKWDTTGAPTDAELSSLGITSVSVTNFVNFMAQYNRLMGNQTTSPISGRVFSDTIKLLD